MASQREDFILNDSENPQVREILLESIFRKYGYDFREYSSNSFDRRLQAILIKFNLKNLNDLLTRVQKDVEFFRRLLPYLTISTTEMFRDPSFFKTLRSEVVPILKTYASLNVWLAGCSTGQEAYSMAMLFKEEGLYEKTVFFATDINPESLKTAREGIYPLEFMGPYEKNYIEAGGQKDFKDYYTSSYGFAQLSSDLKTNIVFSEHNLVADGVFSETNLILCRNVLIYFDKNLQERAMTLFTNSLRYKGILALGSKENLRFTTLSPYYEELDAKQKIYRKKTNEHVEHKSRLQV